MRTSGLGVTLMMKSQYHPDTTSLRPSRWGFTSQACWSQRNLRYLSDTKQHIFLFAFSSLQIIDEIAITGSLVGLTSENHEL